MSLVTPRLGLTKPAGIEQFNLATYNTNLDLIDTSVDGIIKFSSGDRMQSFGNPAFAWGGGSDWDAGPLIPDNDPQASSQVSSPNPAFASQGGSNGNIKFNQAGIYVAQWLIFPVTNPGDAGYKILLAGVWPGTPAGGHTIMGMNQRHNAAPFWETEVMTKPFRVPAPNLEIRFQGKQVNGTTNAAIVRIVQIGKI